MNRRAFLRSAAAMATVAALAPLIPAAPPRLWGDGIHDDTAALQALIDAQVRFGGVVELPPGTYRLSAPLECTGARRVVICGCVFRA